MSFSGRDGTWAILVSYHGFQNRTLWEGTSPFSKLVSESGGNVQIGSLPNKERFHLGTVGSSTANSLEAQLRAGNSTCTGMPLNDHLTENEMTQLQKSGCQLHFGSPDQPVAMMRFVDSPAVAGLGGDVSDDTIVDSDVCGLLFSLWWVSLNSSHKHFVAIPHLMGPTLCGGTIMWSIIFNALLRINTSTHEFVDFLVKVRMPSRLSELFPYFPKSNFPTTDTPFLLSGFLTFGHLLYYAQNFGASILLDARHLDCHYQIFVLSPCRCPCPSVWRTLCGLQQPDQIPAESPHQRTIVVKTV